MEKKQFAVKLKSLLFTGILFFIVACNNNETARLKIRVNEFNDKSVLIEEQRVAGVKFIDSLHFSRKGNLSYKFELKQPNFYNLKIKNGGAIYLLLKPHDAVTITANKDGLVISGSEDSEKLNKLYDSLFTTRELLVRVRNKYNMSIDTELRDSLVYEYNDLIKAHHHYSVRFVLENLTSLISIAALYQELSPNEFVFSSSKDLQFFKLVSDSLSKYFPKHRHVLALKRNFNKMFDSYKVNRLLSSATIVEDALPDISLPDMNGKQVNLFSVPKRYIFLNFWNQNDQISNTLFLKLNKIWKKYRNKDFTIYNVYVGKKTTVWEKVVKFEEIEGWINVADTNFPYSKTQSAYNIQALPSNYLIDKNNNTIIAKDINPAQLNQNLDNILK